MFDKIFKAVLKFFTSPPIRTQFEEMVLQEEVEKQKTTVPPVVADYTPSHGSHSALADEPVEEKPTVITETPVHGAHSAEPVTTQITDSVTQAAPAKPKRAKTAKGKFASDDASTPEVNEAWEGGKAPAKKPRAPRKKKSDAKA